MHLEVDPHKREHQMCSGSALVGVSYSTAHWRRDTPEPPPTESAKAVIQPTDLTAVGSDHDGTAGQIEDHASDPRGVRREK